MSECPYCRPAADREWIPDSDGVDFALIDLPGEGAPHEDECPPPRLLFEDAVGGWSYAGISFCPMCGRDLRGGADE